MFNLDVLFWILRRNEKDVVNLYNYLSDVMRLATNDDMLNFGYWDNCKTPQEAQELLCKVFTDHLELKPLQTIIDVGSGFSAPAKIWSELHQNINIHCMNTNLFQLQHSSKNFNQINGTSTMLPFKNNSVDHVFAFESPQHFKPIDKFISESYRVLKKDGMLSLALPVAVKPSFRHIGILSFTWLSEHYDLDNLKDMLESCEFKIVKYLDIGKYVYIPLANYYINNEKELWNKISTKYPWYFKRILVNSMKKMKKASQQEYIKYILLYCQKD